MDDGGESEMLTAARAKAGPRLTRVAEALVRMTDPGPSFGTLAERAAEHERRFKEALEALGTQGVEEMAERLASAH